jgi:hypothetical protein
VPQLPAPPVPPGGMETHADSALAKRARSELEKISVRFASLAVSASSASNLVVTFSGLAQRGGDDENTSDSALAVSNSDAVVSISATKGIQVTDRSDPDHTSISIGGLHINVNTKETNHWQKIEGSLVGSKLSESQWLFLGAGKLSPVRFEMADADLKDVLPPLAAGAYSHQNLLERLEAAQTITDGSSIKNKSLTALVKDAAAAGDLDLVKSALAQITDVEARDAATRDAALLLAKGGLRKQAIEIAKGIDDSDLRDKALAELAQ